MYMYIYKHVYDLYIYTYRRVPGCMGIIYTHTHCISNANINLQMYILYVNNHLSINLLEHKLIVST